MTWHMSRQTFTDNLRAAMYIHFIIAYRLWDVQTVGVKDFEPSLLGACGGCWKAGLMRDGKLVYTDKEAQMYYDHCFGLNGNAASGTASSSMQPRDSKHFVPDSVTRAFVTQRHLPTSDNLSEAPTAVTLHHTAVPRFNPLGAAGQAPACSNFNAATV